MENPSDKVVVMAMMEGLRLGPLFNFLSQRVSKTLSALQSNAESTLQQKSWQRPSMEGEEGMITRESNLIPDERTIGVS